MYQLLATHKDVMAVRKEWCPVPTEIPAYAREVSEEIMRMMSKADAGVKIASGCVNIVASLAYFKWVKAHGSPLHNVPKFIFLMRDPADLLWARFNFWTTAADHHEHLPGRWTQSDNFRSPQYFHALLMAEGKIVGSYNLTTEYVQKYYTLHALDALIEEAGRDNVLIINSNRLEVDGSDDFITMFSNWSGLSVAGFDEKVLRGRTNSGSTLSSRGLDIIVGNINPKSLGIYEISGFHPMLQKSREFIYRRVLDFCRLVAKKYGIYFDDCLAQPSNSQAGDSGRQKQVSLRQHAFVGKVVSNGNTRLRVTRSSSSGRNPITHHSGGQYQLL